MGRLSRLRDDLRLRAVLVGVAVEFGLLFIYWLSPVSYGSLLRPVRANPVAHAVLLLLFQVLPWLVGGAAAGFLSSGTRRRSGVNGWTSGFVAGFVLGIVGWFLIAASVRVEPAPTYGLADTLRLLVVVPLVFGVGLGLLLSIVGTVGSLLGFEVRQRTRCPSGSTSTRNQSDSSFALDLTRELGEGTQLSENELNSLLHIPSIFSTPDLTYQVKLVNGWPAITMRVWDDPVHHGRLCKIRAMYSARPKRYITI